MITAEEQAERIKLYNMGLTDKEIGDKLFMDRTSVDTWRKRNHLPANNALEKKNIVRNALFKQYYDYGCMDKEIAEKTNTKPNMVMRWRKKNELISNKYIASEQRQEEYLKMYNKGKGDYYIGKMLGVSPVSVLGWRRKHGYPANNKKKGDK